MLLRDAPPRITHRRSDHGLYRRPPGSDRSFVNAAPLIRFYPPLVARKCQAQVRSMSERRSRPGYPPKSRRVHRKLVPRASVFQLVSSPLQLHEGQVARGVGVCGIHEAVAVGDHR